ncbi:MAG: dipeptide transport system permease protein DppC, partial [Acidimicrobiaceae bacterium]|nr:dipeptide transport system permease protein DppC [Acidimicrobiaceae bacterium]
MAILAPNPVPFGWGRVTAALGRPRVRGRWPLWIGGVIVALVVLAVVGAPLLTSWAPGQPDAFHLFDGVGNNGHLLGTDQFGYDVWSRVLYGGRLDLTVGAIAVVLSVVVGGAIGIAIGYVGGWVDETVMRLVDIVQSFPPFVLALTIAVVLQGGNWRFVVVLGLVFAPSYVRLLRSEVRAVRSATFIDAARCVGVPGRTVLTRHVVPNCLGPVFSIAPVNVGWAVITFAGLSFLGLGVNVSTAEWGAMIQGSAS